MPDTESAQFGFDGIGTAWDISTPRPLDGPLRERLLSRVETFDADWSRFRADSRVSSMAHAPGRHEFPAEASRLGPLYRKLYRLTDGAMTPLIGSSLERLGYDAGYSLRPSGSPVAAPDWNEDFEWAGTVITSSSPVVLDIGAAGKGLLADLLAEELLAAGMDSFLIDASGDLLAHGRGASQVALEHPYDPAQAIGIVTLKGSALCASAANRRAWGDGLHHVLDGNTGEPVSTAVATWVLADSGMLADALATALFFVPGDRLEQEFAFSWLTVFSDGSAAHSPGFEGTLFT